MIISCKLSFLACIEVFILMRASRNLIKYLINSSAGGAKLKGRAGQRYALRCLVGKMQSLLGAKSGEDVLAGDVAGECSAYQITEVVILFSARPLPSSE